MKKLALIAVLFSASDVLALHLLAGLLRTSRDAAPFIGAAARLSGPSYHSGSYDDTGVRSNSLQPNQQQVQRSQSPQPEPRRLTVNKVREQAPLPPPAAAVPQPDGEAVPQQGEQVAPQLQAAAAASAPVAPEPVPNAKSYTPYWIMGAVIVAGGAYWLIKKYDLLKKIKLLKPKKKLKAKLA